MHGSTSLVGGLVSPTFVGALVGEPVGDAPARETHRGEVGTEKRCGATAAAKGCKWWDRSVLRAHTRRLLRSSSLRGSFLRSRTALTSEAADRPGVGEHARLGAGRVEPQAPYRKERRYSVQVAAAGLGHICAQRRRLTVGVERHGRQLTLCLRRDPRPTARRRAAARHYRLAVRNGRARRRRPGHRGNSTGAARRHQGRRGGGPEARDGGGRVGGRGGAQRKRGAHTAPGRIRVEPNGVGRREYVAPSWPRSRGGSARIGATGGDRSALARGRRGDDDGTSGTDVGADRPNHKRTYRSEQWRVQVEGACRADPSAATRKTKDEKRDMLARDVLMLIMCSNTNNK
jgi:hypothetical protein